MVASAWRLCRSLPFRLYVLDHALNSDHTLDAYARFLARSTLAQKAPLSLPEGQKYTTSFHDKPIHHLNCNQGYQFLIQFAVYDFCAGMHHQIKARARVEAVKVTPKIEIAGVEAAKMTRIRFSPKCGHIILLTLWFGACAGGTSWNGGAIMAFSKVLCMRGWKQRKWCGNLYSPRTTKNAVWFLISSAL